MDDQDKTQETGEETDVEGHRAAKPPVHLSATDDSSDDVEGHLATSKTISAADGPSDELEESDVEAHQLRQRPSSF